MLAAAVFMVSLTQTAYAAPAQGLTEVKIPADKTAKSLGNDEYQIKFTIPGEATAVKPVLDVVFVLDRSSTADADFKTSLVGMLEALAGNTDEVIYKIGIVTFDQYVTNLSNGLVSTEDKEAYAKLIADINAITEGSGTNLQGGVMLGRSLLDNDKEIAASNKYFILLSDLRGYLFTRTAGGELAKLYRVSGSGTVDAPWVYDGLARYGNIAAGTYTVASIDDLIRKMIIPVSGKTVENAAWLTALDDTGSIFTDNTSAEAAVTAGTALIPSAQTDTIPTSFDKEIYLVGNDWLDMKTAGYNEYLLYSPWHGSVDNHGSLFKSFSEWFEKYIGPKYAADSTAVGKSLASITSDIINAVQKGTLTDQINTTYFTFVDGSFELSYGGTKLTATPLDDGSTGYGTPEEGVYPFVAAVNAGKDTVTLQINKPVDVGNKLEFTFIQKYITGSLVNGGTIATNKEAYLEYMNTSEFIADPTAYKRYMTFESPKVKIRSKYPDTGDSSILLYAVLMAAGAAGLIILPKKKDPE